MKILFLNDSPRPKGYTKQVLNCIEEHLDKQHTIEWVDVNGLNIKPCTSCFQCRPNLACIMKEDDGHHVARLIRNADALVIGSPTYFGNITGPLRTLIDRSLTAFEEIAPSGLEMPIPLHKGKKAAMITACNTSEPICNLPSQGAGALAAMETTLNAGGYHIVGSIIVSSAAALEELPSDVKEKAMEIAQALTEKAMEIAQVLTDQAIFSNSLR
jgi:multimeric flavodoxin WrbA